MIAWLTDTLLMTGAIMALILVVRRPVGRWFGPGAAYALWALPMIRLLLPPLTLPTSLAVTRMGEALAPTISGGSAVEPMPALVARGAAASIPEPSFTVPWATILIAVWLGGALVFLAHRVISYRRMRDELMRDARLIGHAGTVRIVETHKVDAPVAFGVTDRMVALPAGFLATADSDASDFAITHELEHHAGNDLIANMAVQPLFALHWFNPLAWAAWRAFRSDQEAACDARVMAGRSRHERERYGRLIASFAAGSRFALAAPMAGPLRGDKPIIHRLKALVRNDVPERHRMLGRSLFAASVIAVPLTASVTYADDRTAAPIAAVSVVGDANQIASEPGPDQANVAEPEAWARSSTPGLRGPSEPIRALAEDASHEEGMRAHADDTRAHAEVIQTGWEAEHEDAQARVAEEQARQFAAAATRRAHAEQAFAPRVERSFSSDGKIQTLRIVTGGRDGMPVHTSTTVIDSSCPAGRQQITRAVANGSFAETRVCTGTPTVPAHAAAARATAHAARAFRWSDEEHAELEAELEAHQAEIEHATR